MRVDFIMESLPPELKHADQGTPMWVRGKINNADKISIGLSDPTILHLEQL
jgi:hypothetical protein